MQFQFSYSCIIKKLLYISACFSLCCRLYLITLKYCTFQSNMSLYIFLKGFFQLTCQNSVYLPIESELMLYSVDVFYHSFLNRRSLGIEKYPAEHWSVLYKIQQRTIPCGIRSSTALIFVVLAVVGSYF
jgi:hypothetical protein